MEMKYLFYLYNLIMQIKKLDEQLINLPPNLRMCHGNFVLGHFTSHQTCGHAVRTHHCKYLHKI